MIHLDVWLKFRAEMEELRRSGVPYIGPFIRRADIAHGCPDKWRASGPAMTEEGGKE
jgi:hypothetical protein